MGREALRAVTTASNNTAIGKSALRFSTGADNTALGHLALYSCTTGQQNVAVGAFALDASQATSDNTAVGYATLTSEVGGQNNVAVGARALQNQNNASGNIYNTAVGSNAGQAITDGATNTAIGGNALYSLTSADNNTALGYRASYSATTAERNTIVGAEAGQAVTTSVQNNLFGYSAGFNLTTGNRNTLIGSYTGYNVTSGAGNTFIGNSGSDDSAGAGFYMTSGSNNTIIGGFTGNQHGLDIRTSDNHIVLSDGVGNPRGIFDSSGNLLVGKTSTTGTSAAGSELRANGITVHSVTNNPALFLGRLSSDGAIAEFAKDGSTVGSIGTYSSRLFIGSGDTGIFFDPTTDDAVKPWNTSTNAGRDAAIDLGDSGTRFKNLYLSGSTVTNEGVYFGSAVAATHLDDYEEGTFTPTLSGGFSSAPTSYNTREGRYTKIGRYVYFEIDIFPQGATADSSSINIDDLPFTSTSSAPFGGAVITYQTGFNTNAGDTLHIGGNDDDILIADTSGNGRAGNASGVNINQRIIISGWYTAA